MIKSTTCFFYALTGESGGRRWLECIIQLPFNDLHNKKEQEIRGPGILPINQIKSRTKTKAYGTFCMTSLKEPTLPELDTCYATGVELSL